MDEKKDVPAEEKASPPQETFPELKDMREARGLSLRAIFETTRVGLVNLTVYQMVMGLLRRPSVSSQ